MTGTLPANDRTAALEGLARFLAMRLPGERDKEAAT